MKTFKRIFSLVLCLSLILMFSVTGNAETNVLSKIEQKNIESTEGYTKLFESFRVNGATETNNYPSSYGGAYIDDEVELVIQYANDSKRSLSSVQNDISMFKEKTQLDSVKTEMVQVSYKDLKETSELIGKYIPKIYDTAEAKRSIDDKNLGFNIVQSALDEKNNSIIVWLDDLSDKNIEAFRQKISNAPYIVFKQATDSEIAVQEASYE